MNIFDDFISQLKLKKNNNNATVVFLHGDLGSGKTTFTKNLCKHIGLDLDISSPTFVILKKYDFNGLYGFKNLIHIDAYRLKSFDDLKKIKFDDYFENKDNLIFIEWPSIIVDGFNKSDINMYFEYSDNLEDRNIKIA